MTTATTREANVTRERDGGADLRLLVAIPLPEPVEQALGGPVNRLRPASVKEVMAAWCAAIWRPKTESP